MTAVPGARRDSTDIRVLAHLFHENCDEFFTAATAKEIAGETGIGETQRSMRRRLARLGAAGLAGAGIKTGNSRGWFITEKGKAFLASLEADAWANGQGAAAKQSEGAEA